MPTAYPRTLVTRTPRVERIIAAGKARWPDRPPGEILVSLAEEALDAQPRHKSLMMLPSVPGHTITTQMVQDLLDDD
jgi:hypothetical protein